ncbi:hypothetical protein [Enterococcus pallens]|uniref:Uncharacterized protein n=1 Tax=Enterococcus pallens ATCC BAA-351 TaxID=1158607 RepID=R2SEM2_9ENTE|nr:hypothetical protein [Enterococcus pallens]EOH91331.1 hypothetical protein UAU_03290 [Enterococcus pallens ATCC BAA-351]EOU15949.1 hypothetical protein I588_03605 [Enterococcus pallens ATCC BAA-351]
MTYKRIKPVGAYCPNCQRRLEILLEDTSQRALCLCFRCRTIYEINEANLQKIPVSKQMTETEKEQVAQLLQALPEKYQYKGQGSQLRETNNGFQRSWLSLAAYEQQFGEALGYKQCDLRLNPDSCKWCGSNLPKGRRSFCKDSCSRNYSQATFTKRHMASLPYRIACRDRFYCQISGEDLAQINRYGQRIPASNGNLAIHHLVFVAENGTDYEQNLLTLSSKVHCAYHAGDKAITAKVHAIRDQRLEEYGLKMFFTQHK